MRKIIFMVANLMFCFSLFGQDAKAIKPTLMLMPSEGWCKANGYTMQFDNQGTPETVPNYKEALNNPELSQAIAKISEIMIDKGFPLTNLSSAIRNMEQELAINRTMTSKSGATIAESPTDMLKRVAKPDIVLELGYTVTPTGPKKTLSYDLHAYDAYTSGDVARSADVTASFSADIPTLLQAAVLANMDNFASQLLEYFGKLFEEGREATVTVQVWDNPGKIDLETEFNGKELNEIINDWMYQNTVQHRYRRQSSSENYMVYNPIRIPLFNGDGMPMEIQLFAQGLQKYLKAAPYNITSKVDQRGLGQAVLIIGEK